MLEFYRMVEEVSIRFIEQSYETQVNKLKFFLDTEIKQINNINHLSNEEKENRIQKSREKYSGSLINLTDITNRQISNILSNYKPRPNTQINKKTQCLLVGINYFKTNYELFGCINDVQTLRIKMNASGFKNIVTLTDDKNPKPTRKVILDNFTNLLRRSQPGELIVFTYSGHGSNIRDRNGDETDKMDELIFPCDLNRILDDELKTIIQQNLKKNVTLFALFDCCFSGTVLDLKYQYMDSMNYDKDIINNKNLDTHGDVIMISGCTDNQYSADAYIDKKYQGAMTWSFIESLRQLKNPSWRELVKNMRTLLKTNGYDQIPQLSCGRPTNVDSKVFI
jgi:hypothetical protein